MKTILPLVGMLVAALTASAQPAPVAVEKLFAVRFTVGPAWDAARPPQEQPHFAAHSANLARLRQAGVLLLGARYADTGLVVLRAADEATARAEFDADPTLAGGVFLLQVDVFVPFYHGSTRLLTSPEAVVLRAYLDAYNRHDAAAVAALCAEEFKFFSIDGDQLSTDVAGRTPLHEWLLGYFTKYPDMRSEFLALEQAGAFLTVRERPTWTDQAGRQVSRQAIGVYEIRDERIVRAWYFSSLRDSSR